MRKPNPYAFKLQNNSNETVKYALFRKKDKIYHDKKVLQPESVFDGVSYENCLHEFLQMTLKFNKISLYSDSVIQKRLPIQIISRDANGQSANVPIFLDEKDEINDISLNVKTDEIEVMVLPNSTSIIYFHKNN
jgi:hypothetical protein